MSNEDEQVVDSRETTTENLEDNDSSYGEDDSTSEDETTSSEQDGEQSSTKVPSETPEQRLARLKRQYERELKKQGQEGSQKGSQEENSQVDEKYLRLELKTEGLKSTKEQDVVVEYIREKALLGKEVDVPTAMNALVVREELEKIRRAESVPKPSSRTSGGASDSMSYYVNQIKKGNMRLADVPDREMRKKISSTRGLF